MAAVKRRFPTVRQPKQQDICYATQNRQDAVKVLAPGVDVLIVVGSPRARTATVCASWPSGSAPTPTWSTAPTTCSAAWLAGKRRVGLTAGASAPEILVQQVDRAAARARRGLGAHRARRRRDSPLPPAAGARRPLDERHAAALARVSIPYRAPGVGGIGDAARRQVARFGRVPASIAAAAARRRACRRTRLRQRRRAHPRQQPAAPAAREQRRTPSASASSSRRAVQPTTRPTTPRLGQTVSASEPERDPIGEERGTYASANR